MSFLCKRGKSSSFLVANVLPEQLDKPVERLLPLRRAKLQRLQLGHQLIDFLVLSSTLSVSS